MARYRDSVCRLCRRENLKMFLKGDRCYSDKCAIDRRNYPPGQHGQGRSKHSEYAVQLREKQKVKWMYGLLENQFRGTFKHAERMKGITGTNLLVLLERRLDNVIYRLGFGNSRNQARQLVRHQHFLVNGRKTDIPSFQIRVGDTITIREKSRGIASILESMEAVARRGVPQWLELDRAAFAGTVKSYPEREELTSPIQEQLIVELYSK